jgi:hypothetical protein
MICVLAASLAVATLISQMYEQPVWKNCVAEEAANRLPDRSIGAD